MKLSELFKSKNETLGARGEREAAAYFKKLGFKIVERNYRSSHYEIDFIAKNRTHIVFVEVKSRSCESPDNMPYGRPAAAVTKDKQRFLIYAAKAYMRAHPKLTLQPRLDVIEVYFNNEGKVKDKKILKINHFQNAFGE
jgi:putative endonuclease